MWVRIADLEDNPVERRLRKDKLLETAKGLQSRIAKRFPEAGLAGVAAEIVQITNDAINRAESISRPNLWLRAGLVVLLVIALAGVATYIQTRDDQRPLWQTILEFLDATKGSAAILGATAIFLFTLETRLKRRRALQAVHELRAIAHLIDMHQLTKDPARIGDRTDPVNVAGQVLDAQGISRYLHFSTELLAIVSKVGQLYVEDFPDSTAVTAVDHFESLATGLSNKIWQKLMILDRVQPDTDANTAPGSKSPDEAEVSPEAGAHSSS